MIKGSQTDECINGLMSTKENKATQMYCCSFEATHTQVVIKKPFMHQYFNTDVWNSL